MEGYLGIQQSRVLVLKEKPWGLVFQDTPVGQAKSETRDQCHDRTPMTLLRGKSAFPKPERA